MCFFLTQMILQWSILAIPQMIILFSGILCSPIAGLISGSLGCIGSLPLCCGIPIGALCCGIDALTSSCLGLIITQINGLVLDCMGITCDLGALGICTGGLPICGLTGLGGLGFCGLSSLPLSSFPALCITRGGELLPQNINNVILLVADFISHILNLIGL
jgi:hypothetical protein